MKRSPIGNLREEDRNEVKELQPWLVVLFYPIKGGSKPSGEHGRVK